MPRQRVRRIWLVGIGLTLLGFAIFGVWHFDRNSIQFDFVDKLPLKQQLNEKASWTTLYEGKGDFESVCRRAAQELVPKGWRKVERYGREERWEAASHMGTILIREARVEVEPDLETIDFHPGVVSVEVRVTEETLWTRIRRMIGL